MLFAPFRKAHPRRFKLSRSYEGVLGSSMELVVLATYQAAAEVAEESALSEIDRLEKVFSVYRQDSELNLWQQTFDEEIAISSELAQVLHAAEQWRQITGGAFLPTVEANTRIWREREAGNQKEEFFDLVPSEPLWQVDLKQVTAKRLTRHPASLNAIAKGFIIDRALEAAASTPQVIDVLINIGGDLRHRGEQKIAVDIVDPFHAAENHEPIDTIFISGLGVATSGGYRRGFTVNNRWHSHLLNPRDGTDVVSVRSATVAASTTMEADAMATALIILGQKGAKSLADMFPYSAFLMILDDKTQVSNSAWKSLQSL